MAVVVRWVMLGLETWVFREGREWKQGWRVLKAFLHSNQRVGRKWPKLVLGLGDEQNNWSLLSLYLSPVTYPKRDILFHDRDQGSSFSFVISSQFGNLWLIGEKSFSKVRNKYYLFESIGERVEALFKCSIIMSQYF